VLPLQFNEKILVDVRL